MWLRFLDSLVCPLCRGTLDLIPGRQREAELPNEVIEHGHRKGISADRLRQAVDSGLLLCGDCRVKYPVFEGLPVLLPYETPLHTEFAAIESDLMQQCTGYRWADVDPAPGEHFVMRSFSREWLEYDYDGVLWDLSYEDHKRRVFEELGVEELNDVDVFLELGCGIGMTTNYAQQALGGDAIGIDLSLAALSATQEFRENPFLHFAQASVFNLPLRRSLADVVYSHGVLHHTYSTEEAFMSLAESVKAGGMLYIWIYGPGSLKGSIARRLAWRLEALSRPYISRNLDSAIARLALGLLALPYFAANAWHRLNDPSVQKYDFTRALHAARDRFTPLYAHRHGAQEVIEWFERAGYERVEQVDWRTMPTANQDNFRRNVGVRGWRSGPSSD